MKQIKKKEKKKDKTQIKRKKEKCFIAHVVTIAPFLTGINNAGQQCLASRHIIHFIRTSYFMRTY